MDEIDRKIVQIIDKDPVKVLKHNKIYVKNLKKENEELKKQINLLMRNNKTLVELIEVIEEKVKTLTEYERKNYIYDYEKGGWEEEGSLDKERFELAKSDLNIHKINLQLAEIINLMKLHKERNIREE